MPPPIPTTTTDGQHDAVAIAAVADRLRQQGCVSLAANHAGEPPEVQVARLAVAAVRDADAGLAG